MEREKCKRVRPKLVYMQIEERLACVIIILAPIWPIYTIESRDAAGGQLSANVY